MEQPDHKYIVWLKQGDGRSAVVVDWTPEAAIQRAYMANPYAGWEDSSPSILTRVRRSMTSRVVAMED